jgi:hypothetical protein
VTYEIHLELALQYSTREAVKLSAGYCSGNTVEFYSEGARIKFRSELRFFVVFSSPFRQMSG